MARKVQVPWEGGTHDAIELPFEIVKEDWCEYALADGDRVRVRNTLIRILGLIDQDGQPIRGQFGERPVVVVQGQPIVTAE